MSKFCIMVPNVVSEFTLNGHTKLQITGFRNSIFYFLNTFYIGLYSFAKIVGIG